MRSAEYGFTFVKRSAEHGFTLVELMVVVVIIGIASAAVALSIPDPRGRLVDDADRFAARVRAAHDAAIIDARSVSVWVAPGGYGFDQRAGGSWVPIDEKPLRVTRWQTGVRPTIVGARARLIFDPTGLSDQPMDVRLARGGQAVTVHIGAGGDVRVHG